MARKEERHQVLKELGGAACFSYATARSMMFHLKFLMELNGKWEHKYELTFTVFQTSDAVGLYSPLREQVDRRLVSTGVLREPQPAVFHSASAQHRQHRRN